MVLTAPYVRLMLQAGGGPDEPPRVPRRCGSPPTSVGVVVFLVCVFPVYWMVNTSLLPRREIRSPDPTWLPFGGTLDNYRRVFEGDQFLDALR